MDPKTFFDFKNFFQNYEGQDLSLIRLASTEGATYQKAGAVKLVHKSGESVGMISGGCLEAEIVKKGLTEKEFSIDTTADQDRLLGYGVGCQGKLNLVSQKVRGPWSLFCSSQLNFKEQKIPHLHIVGAGLDAQALIRLVASLAWPFSVHDHRRDLVGDLKKKNWPVFHHSSEINLSENEKLNLFILMSHTYEFDLNFLNYAVKQESPFVGILGPKEKKLQLIDDLAKIHNSQVSPSMESHIHGPIGEKTLGRGPQAIAISIVAELQREIYGQL